MVRVGVLPGENPDTRFYSVDLIELSLALQFIDDETMRAIIDRYSREEIEYSHLLLALLVLCRVLLDCLQHLV